MARYEIEPTIRRFMINELDAACRRAMHAVKAMSRTDGGNPEQGYGQEILGTQSSAMAAEFAARTAVIAYGVAATISRGTRGSWRRV